ncbi:MAG: hypothetical protein N2Z21_09470, partial [Candidatus Sumerlaeaceae bacterium]|nr:hypothetical protein [Candidatus Sumerlaeaceae bacterium]
MMLERWQKFLVVGSIALALAAVVWRLAHPVRWEQGEISHQLAVVGDSAAEPVALKREHNTSGSVPKRSASKRVSEPLGETAKRRLLPADETTIPQGRAALVVTVLDRRNDSPVAGVRLEASRWESVDVLASHDFPLTLARLGVTVRPEGAGGMRLADIPAPSRVWLRLGANGYESVEVGPIELAPDGAVVRQVYFLSPRASVVGRVVEKGRRTPIG